MKKTAFAALAVVLGATSANAGLLESLGLAKKAEPQTLAEACDMDELKKICPEVVVGSETITDCLIENAKSLSKQCATYIKKSVAEKAAAIKEEVAAASAAADEKSAADKAAADEKKAAIKAAAAEKKAALQAAGKEVVEAVHETGAAAKETGAAFKNIL